MKGFTFCDECGGWLFHKAWCPVVRKRRYGA